MVSIFKAVNDLIDTFTTYKNDVIYKNYFNNVTLPKDNHYAVIMLLDSMPQMALTADEYIPNENDKTVKGIFKQVNSVDMQVDFYGKQAEEQSNLFAVLLQSRVGTEFVKELGYTIRDSDSPIQISNPQDRGNYILRYVVRFKMFQTVTLERTYHGFTDVTIETNNER